ncbi:type I toxin-antitoxin system Fst family toxin [Streptococcus pneumoniae]
MILYGTSTPPTKGGEIAHDGISTQPIVVGVVLRIVDKWLNKDK